MEAHGAALDPSALSDLELCARVRAGEPHLFEVLIRRTNETLYRAVRAILKSEAEVEDVMQEAYVAAYLHLDQFAGKAKFSTWAVRIGVNEALTKLRKTNRAADLGAELDEDLPSADRTPEQRASARDALAQLEEAVDALPDGYRAVLVLREIDGLSTEETASTLGLSEEAVKVRLHRARARLRQQLGDRTPELVDAFLFNRVRCDRVAAAVLRAIGAVARVAPDRS